MENKERKSMPMKNIYTLIRIREAAYAEPEPCIDVLDVYTSCEAATEAMKAQIEAEYAQISKVEKDLDEPYVDATMGIIAGYDWQVIYRVDKCRLISE